MFAHFRLHIATESERCFCGARFSVALLSSLTDFATEIHFARTEYRVWTEENYSIFITYEWLFSHDNPLQLLISSVERQTPTQQDKKNNAGAPGVHWFAVEFSSHEFGRHVIWCADSPYINALWC